ncbi:MAG: hypothetical protein FJ388_14270 [Verrucomicrobia bacterium]|nr:hypothetical protein [Verrucomicrobiota bacterium]
MRVVEDGQELPSQFDRAAKFDAQQHAAGNVVWIAKGKTPAKTSRFFAIYFDVAANGPKPAPNYTGVTTVARHSVAGSAQTDVSIPPRSGGLQGARIENSRIKVLLGAEGGHAYVWQVKSLGGLDITQPGERDWAGFLDVRGYRNEPFTLTCEARGPVLVRYRMTAADGFTKTVSFYADQPWCQTFLSLATTYFWDFDNAELMSATSKTPGKYLFSDGATDDVLKPGELSVAREGTFWGAKFRPDGLTLGNVTPDDRVQHRVGPGGGMGGVGSEGRNPATHFVTFGDVIAAAPDKLPAHVKQTMDALQRTLGLSNQPVISISTTEKRP